MYNVRVKILIGTRNPAKLTEIKKGLSELENHDIFLISLNELCINEEPDEKGKTFEANSLFKAKYYAIKSSYATIADDGGLIIPILNNEPGVKSKRWLGYDAADKELVDYTLKRLNGIPQEKRTAYLQTCITYFDPKTKIIFTETEKVKGYISEKQSAKSIEEYPYRSLFVVERFNKFYDELTEKEHHAINHRLIALKRLTKQIIAHLIQ